MKNLGTSFYNFALTCIKYLSLLIAALLFICGFLFTCYAVDMESQQVLTRADNILMNLLGIVLFSGLTVLVCKWVNHSPEKRKRILLAFVFLWYLLAGCILILFSKTVPSADPMSVYSCAAELAIGNTGVIHPADSYLSYYPQQMGLVAYYEIIIRIWNLLPIDQHAYHFIKCINLIWALVIIFFQYKTVQLLFKSHTADTVYLLLSLLHLPLLLYTSYVYGEIPSFALFSIGVWALFQLFEGASARKQICLYSICSILAFTASVALRKNTLVLMIAVFIVTVFESIRRRCPKMFLLAAVYMLCAVMILPGIQAYYELRAGNELRSGVPAMSYFAMGMQEGGRAAGWYNGFNFNTYDAAAMDTAATNEISLESILQRLTTFKEYPLYAGQFYSNKFLSQWSDGTYASLQATLATFGGRRAFFQELYDGKYSGIFREYCNLLQNQIYLGVLIFAIISTKNRHLPVTIRKLPHILPGSHYQAATSCPEKDCDSVAMIGAAISCQEKEKTLAEKQGLPVYLLMIGVIGGLLFHMIWEANARYIFPYGLLLLPYAARGIERLLRCTCDYESKPSLVNRG